MTGYASGGYESPKTIPTCTFQVGAIVVNRRTMWVGMKVGVGLDMTCGCANFDVVSCGCGCEYIALGMFIFRMYELLACLIYE